MNDQPIVPLTPAPPPSHINAILIGVLGTGAVIFAVLTVLSFGQATTAKNTLNSNTKAAADAAHADQQKQDAAATSLAGESPFRSYQASADYGSFKINFPKDWSSTVDEEQSATTQVTLEMNPDFIRKTAGIDGLLAAKVQLIQHTSDVVLKSYAGTKTVTQSSVTVSGINAVQLTGTFPDKRSVRVVLVPVRDKTIVFSSENAQYSKEFDLILAQSTIIP